MSLLHCWCSWSCCTLGAHSVYTMHPCASLQRHFMQSASLQCHFMQSASLQCYFMKSHKSRVHVTGTCHLHFWQNGQDLLHATVETWGWDGYRNKSRLQKLSVKGEVWEKRVPKEGLSWSVISTALHQQFYCIIVACLLMLQLLLLSVASSDVYYRGVSILVPALLGWIIMSVVFIFSRHRVKVVKKFCGFTHKCCLSFNVSAAAAAVISHFIWCLLQGSVSTSACYLGMDNYVSSVHLFPASGESCEEVLRFYCIIAACLLMFQLLLLLSVASWCSLQGRCQY